MSMEAHGMDMAQMILQSVAVILAAGALFGKVADRLKIPDVVMYLAAGILLGPPGLNLVRVPVESVLNQLILTMGACALLFHGGTGIRVKNLREVWVTLTLLSTAAVLIMVAVVGVAAHLAFGMELIYGLLLAAVIASTDPATLVPVFLSVRVKERLAQTVLSESAFNDATGAIVTVAIIGMITTGGISLPQISLQFILMAGGGIVIGMLGGAAAGFLVSQKSGSFLSGYAQAVILPLIIAAYLTAEKAGASGFMAVFVAGLVIGNLDEIGWRVKKDNEEEIHSFINSASLLLRIAIFLLLGTHVDFAVVWQYLLPGVVVIGVFMFVARPLAVLFCTLPDRKAQWGKNEILFMCWTRETGVIPAALAGMLIGKGMQYAEVIAAVTFLAILATLAIQATTTKWLAGRLGLLQEEGRDAA